MRFWALIAALGVVVLLAPAGSISLAASERATAPATSCPQVLVLGSRGSGESVEQYLGFSQPGIIFLTRLQRLVGRNRVGYWANPYPARGLSGGWRELLNLLGAGTKLSGIGLGAYHDSVTEGKRLLAERIKTTVKACGSRTWLVLVGYSQGAQVAADAFQNKNVDTRLSPKELEQVIGVVLFGDPYFNGGSLAARGRGFSRQRHGVLGRRAEFSLHPFVLSVRVRSYCHGHDPICQGPFIRSGSRIPDPKIFGASGPRLINHENYAEFGEPEEAAQGVALLAPRFMWVQPGPWGDPSREAAARGVDFWKPLERWAVYLGDSGDSFVRFSKMRWTGWTTDRVVATGLLESCYVDGPICKAPVHVKLVLTRPRRMLCGDEGVGAGVFTYTRYELSGYAPLKGQFASTRVC